MLFLLHRSRTDGIELKHSKYKYEAHLHNTTDNACTFAYFFHFSVWSMLIPFLFARAPHELLKNSVNIYWQNEALKWITKTKEEKKLLKSTLTTLKHYLLLYILFIVAVSGTHSTAAIARRAMSREHLAAIVAERNWFRLGEGILHKATNCAMLSTIYSAPSRSVFCIYTIQMIPLYRNNNDLPPTIELAMAMAMAWEELAKSQISTRR